MKITDFLNLLGGLALFLYGMQMMSAGLEAAAGNRMKRILEKLTSNRLLGVAVGAGITAVIQSSSATTVMVVGFVNSGMMTLLQAVWIIMGANIGTTVTGQLIALDVGVLAPLIAFVGVSFVVFLKKPGLRHIGQILAGLGVLFIGMEMMNAAMMPLRDSEGFIRLMTHFSNPLLGILAGAAFTAVIQSSSASVGILQALAASGLIGLPSAVYVLFGQNIGTCITAVLASIGTSRGAKRTTIIHLLFNVIGTTVFTLLCMATPLTSFVEALTPGHAAAQIANMHTLFNIATTLLLLPLGGLLADVATRILPERKEEQAGELRLCFIKPLGLGENRVGFSAMYLAQLQQELRRMLSMARENVEESFQAVLGRDPGRLAAIDEREDYIDYLNKEISLFISKLITHEHNEEDSRAVSAYFKITGNIERISDHAVNLCGYSRLLQEKDIRFSGPAADEIQSMMDASLVALDQLKSLDGDGCALSEAERIEQMTDEMTVQFRQNQLARMRAGTCSEEGCVLYSEMLTDFERIGDHTLNIAQELAALQPAAVSASSGAL